MDILNQRLVSQQLSVHRFNKAGELVHWHAAIQAQDYAMAKWAIGDSNHHKKILQIRSQGRKDH